MTRKWSILSNHSFAETLVNQKPSSGILRVRDQIMSSTTTLLAPMAIDTQAERERRLLDLFSTEQRRALSLVWRILGPHASSAEDILQTAFAKSWNKINTLRDPSRMRPWLYQIIVREAYSHRRKQSLRQFLSFGQCSPEVLSERPTAGDPGLRAQISRAMDGLPTMQRTTFTLIHLEGFTVSETAEILDIAVGTTKSHLHRALKHLRRDLRALAPDRSGDSA